MRKLLILIILPLFISSCAEQSESNFVDESHRPKDWHSTIEVRLDSSFNADVWHTYFFQDLSENPEYEGLIDQLFDFAFSGEAAVYAPDVLGEISSRKLDPKELHDFLKRTDTVYVSDLNAQELTDTVEVDISFKKELVSLILVNGKLVKNGGDLSFLPLNAAIGAISLNEFGEYRGDKPEFYLSFANEIEAIEYDFSMEIRSDSNGIYHLESFKDFLIGRDLEFEVGDKLMFDLDFNFLEKRMNCSAIKQESGVEV